MSTRTAPRHLSPTQIDTYCRCPEAYRRRYVEGEKIPPGIALLKGKGFHAGAETNMRQKIDSHEDLPASDIVDASVASFEAEMQGGFALSTDEAFRGAKVVLGEAKDSLVSLAKAHAEQQAPEYQPVMVEERVEIELTPERSLVGVIDLADDKGRVVDFKTAGKSKSQSEADASIQLTTYAAAYHVHQGEPPSLVQLDVLVSGKKGVKRQVLESRRGVADFTALANRINAVAAAIDAGIFPPAPPGAWQCSPRWCGYWNSCAYINSERAALAEGDE